jgi:ATP-binding protein involved in chromosome partitioning
VALAQSGLKTGLLDADIYGPSVPMMMGLRGVRAETGPDKKITPLMAHGVKCMSMGMLVDTDAPMIWRGPMVQSAIVQMLRDVDWAGETGLDVLVVDMPPGTGDAQLTLAQKVKLSGAIIVTTPQDVAMLDARKCLEMFQKTGVKILGVVENMSVFCCPNCGHESAIFGAGAARDLAARMDVPFLGALPIEVAVRERGDAGTPEPGKEYQGIVTQIISVVGV